MTNDLFIIEAVLLADIHFLSTWKNTKGAKKSFHLVYFVLFVVQGQIKNMGGGSDPKRL